MVLTTEQIEDIKAQLQGLSPEEQKEKMQEILANLPEEDREQLIGKPQCPFCLIAEGKIETKKIYEDDTVMAVLDINPASRGHTLLFTKKHYQFLGQIEDNELSHLMNIAKAISEALLHSLSASGTNILINNGPGAGQTSPHLLVNIIPRYENDGISFKWVPQKASDRELEDTAKAVSSAIKTSGSENIIKEEAYEVEKEDYRIP